MLGFSRLFVRRRAVQAPRAGSTARDGRLVGALLWTVVAPA